MESSSNIKEAFFLNLFKGNVKEEPHPTPPVFVTLYNNGLGNRAHSSVYKEYKFFNQIKEYYKRKAEPLLPALGWGKGYGGCGAPASVLGGSSAGLFGAARGPFPTAEPGDGWKTPSGRKSRHCKTAAGVGRGQPLTGGSSWDVGCESLVCRGGARVLGGRSLRLCCLKEPPGAQCWWMNEQQGQGRSQSRALPMLLQSSAGCAASPALGGAKPLGPWRCQSTSRER